MHLYMHPHPKDILVEILNCFSDISRSFALGQQQDAHEFLLYLMEGMQKSCKSDGSSTTQAGDTSSVSEIFIGKMKSQVMWLH